MPASDKDLARTVRRWVIGVLLGSILLVIASFLIWRATLSSRINASLARIKAAGYPANPKELNQWYRDVPTNENAALLFLAAAEDISAADFGIEREVVDWIATNRTSLLPPDLKERLTLRLDENRSALSRLHGATSKTRSRYPIDLSEGADCKLKHLTRIKDAAWLLRAESVELCDNGLIDDAAESIRIIYRIAQSLADEPTMMSQLVRFSITAVGQSGLQKVLCTASVRAPILKAFITTLEGADNVVPLQRGLAGERVMDIPFFRFEEKALLQDKDDPVAAFIDEETKRRAENAAQTFVRQMGVFERDLRFYLDTMETNLAIVALCEPNNLAATNYVATQALKARQRYYLCSCIFLRNLERDIARHAEHAARVRTARAALAIELFRAEHNGERPASLEALAPAYLKQIPKDPFDGQPLRYKLRSKGYVVYSIGADGKDDDGKERPPRSKGGNREESFDITLTVDR